MLFSTTLMHYYLHIYLTFLFKGDETYENQKKFGQQVFDELKDIDRNGLTIDGIWHEIHVSSSCDWKAAACIEGIYNKMELHEK